METEQQDLEQMVDEWRVPDPFDVSRFPHLDPRVLEIARGLRGPYSPKGANRQVRIARVVDGLRYVAWSPSFTELARVTGMKTSTVFDQVTRLHSQGMYAEIALHVPGGPVIRFAT